MTPSVSEPARRVLVRYTVHPELVEQSGQIAFASYRRSDARPVFEPHSIELLTVRGDRISGITAFRSSERFAGFGLPCELPA